MWLIDQVERRPLQMSLPMTPPAREVTDGWLHRKPLLSGDFQLCLHSEYMATLAPRRMIDHLPENEALASKHFIVAMEWSKTYGIEIFCPDEDRSGLKRAWLLEECPADWSKPQRQERQRVWETLAIFAGIQLRSRIGVDESRLVIAQAQQEPGLIEDALSIRSRWPLGFRAVEGAARNLLLGHANRFRNTDHSTAGLDLIVFGDAPTTAPAVEILASAVEPLVPYLESLVMNETKSTDAAPVGETGTTGHGDLPVPVDVFGPFGLDDRLSSPLSDIVNLGLARHTFSYVGHDSRLLVPWSIVMTLPQHRRNHGLVYDLLIRRDIDPTRYINNSCVLAVGRYGDGDKKVSNPLGVLWRAVAACFGINAVSNGHFAVQPFTHPRTLRALRKSPAKVLELIDAWPIAEHAPLKEIARARARAAALGQVTPMTQAEVDALSASAPKSEDDLENESEAESGAPLITETPKIAPLAVDIVTDEIDAIPETIPMSTSLPADAFTEIAAMSADIGAVNARCEPSGLARVHRRTRVTAPSTAESMIDAALGANRRARDALKAEIESDGQAILDKRALMDRLETEVTVEQDRFAAKSKQLDQFNALINGLTPTV